MDDIPHPQAVSGSLQERRMTCSDLFHHKKHFSAGKWKVHSTNSRTSYFLAGRKKNLQPRWWWCLIITSYRNVLWKEKKNPIWPRGSGQQIFRNFQSFFSPSIIKGRMQLTRRTKKKLFSLSLSGFLYKGSPLLLLFRKSVKTNKSDIHSKSYLCFTPQTVFDPGLFPRFKNQMCKMTLFWRANSNPPFNHFSKKKKNLMRSFGKKWLDT